MTVVIDERLKSVYDQAMKILHDNEEILLARSTYASLAGAMMTIVSVGVSRCRTAKRRGVCKYDHGNARIEISEYMLAFPEKEILTTMVHELLHAFNDSYGHNGLWKWRAETLSEITGLNIARVRTIENEYDIRMAYEKEHGIKHSHELHYSKNLVFRCEKCGCEIVRHKESNFTRHPSLYKHTKCGGTFERVGVEL